MVKKSARNGRTKTSRTSPLQKVIEPDGHGAKERITNEPADIVILQSNTEKPSETLVQDSEVETGQRTALSSLHEFWERFRLSPVQAEHVIQTNMGWLTLVTLSPLFLLVVLRLITILAYYNSIEQPFKFDRAEVFSDLGDSIYTPISLSLFLSAFIFRYRWYKTLPQTFASLLENEALRSKEGRKITGTEFEGFLEDYQCNLHSRKRYVLPLISLVVSLGTAISILSTRGFWSIAESNEFGPFLKVILISHISIRWIVTPVLFSSVISLWFWSLISTTKAIRNLATRFRIYVQPLHSDRAGGLKRLGDLSSSAGLLIVVAASTATVVAVPGTIRSTKFMSYGDLFQVSQIIANFMIYYVLDFVILVALALAFYVVIWPLLDIHDRMAEYKRKMEGETNRHISLLLEELNLRIREDEFEEADRIKAKIRLLIDEQTTIQKYPTWPIRPLLVAGSYLTSSFVTALTTSFVTAFVSYIFSLLKEP